MSEFFNKNIVDLRSIIKRSNLVEGVRQISTTSKFNHIFGTSFRDEDLIFNRDYWTSIKYMKLSVLIKIPEFDSVYYEINFNNKYIGNNCYSVSVSGIKLSSNMYGKSIVIDKVLLAGSDNAVIDIKVPSISIEKLKSPILSLSDRLKEVISSKKLLLDELKESIVSGSIVSIVNKYIRSTNTDYDSPIERISYNFINNNPLSLNIEDFVVAYSAAYYCDGSFTSFMELDELREFTSISDRILEASKIVDKIKPKIGSTIDEVGSLDQILEEFNKEKNEFMSNLIDKYREMYKLSDRSMDELLVRSRFMTL